MRTKRQSRLAFQFMAHNQSLDSGTEAHHPLPHSFETIMQFSILGTDKPGREGKKQDERTIDQAVSGAGGRKNH